MKRATWWKIGVGLAIAASLGGAVAASRRAGEKVVRVEPGVIERRVIARAVVAPIEGVSEVRAQIDARVLRVHVAEGDHVEAGQLLAELDDTALRLAVARARAEVGAQEASVAGLRRGGRREAQRELLALLRSAERELDLAEDQARRSAQLRETGAISEVTQRESAVGAEVARERVEALRARYDASRSGAGDDVRAADYRLEATQAALDLAQEELSRAHIVARAPGVVLARRIDPGDVVRTIDGAAMFDVADPARVELRAEVEESQATLVRAGAVVVVSSSGGRDVLGRGRVARLAPHVGRRSISGDPSELRADSLVRDVFVALDDGTRLDLPIGERVEVAIEMEPRNAAARVPRGAVALHEGHAVVEVARGPFRERRAVQLLAADDRYVEVRGVDPGTQVVVAKP
jgi:multidrug resistance efflux pump